MHQSSHGHDGRGGSRRLLALGAAAVILITACGSSGSASPSAAAGSDKPYAGTTLHMLMEDLTETHYINDLLPDLEAKTGIKVEFEQVPYSNMYEKLVPQLSGPEKSGTYDVVAVDYYWPGEFARSGWMTPLDDMIAKDKTDLSGIIPAFFDVNGKVDGKTYYIPYFPYPMGIVYRKDLGVQIPKTMDELVAYAKSLKKGDMYGAAMQGAPTDPIAMEWLNFLFANGGDLYAADLKTPTVNNATGLKALTQYLDMMDNAAQTGAAGANLDDASNTFAQGKAAMMVTYVTIFAGFFQDPEKSSVVDKWDVTAMPGTNQGNVGVWSFGIPKSSKNAGAAWEFIKWATSENIARQRALKGGSPAYTSFYSDPEILKKFPYLTKALDILNNGKGLPMITKQQDLVATLGRELSEAASKRKTPQEALDAIAAKLVELAK
jgi:ABC-type glycerol-3-phosphate transport system substrate-binding protein